MMKLTINENTVKIPPCPKKEKPLNYKDKLITKMCKDGLGIDFYILTSKQSATAFIYRELNDYNFPMVALQSQLNDYLKDEEWYKDDMLNWEDRGLYPYLEGNEQTFCYFSDNSYAIIEEGLESAIMAYKKAKNVTSLERSDGYCTELYGGYIVYEDDVDIWRSYLDLPNEINFKDYTWEKVGATFIQKI